MSQLVPKSEKMMQKTRETDGVRKTEMLYFKVKIGSISLEKHTHPLQIDSFTDNKNDLSDVRK